jgi:hypothetical protein
LPWFSCFVVICAVPTVTVHVPLAAPVTASEIGGGAYDALASLAIFFGFA